MNARLEPYLASDSVIEADHPAILEIVRVRLSGLGDEFEKIGASFRFVRDEVSHSADVQSRVVTCTASEVLEHRVGICYAKAHLLAAILRAQGVPAGLCYQRLLFGDTPEEGYVIHALNAAFLFDEARWVRMDARGNRPGVDAQLSRGEEKLAFPVRPELGEIDYDWIDSSPAPETLRALQEATDAIEMYTSQLPDRIS